MDLKTRGMLLLLVASAAGGASAAAEPALDLAPLKVVIAGIARFEADAAALSSQEKIRKTEFLEFRDRSDALIERLPATERTFNDVIARLKAKGKWTEDLDARVLQRARQAGDAELVNALIEKGGARALIDLARSQFPVIGREFGRVVLELQPRSVLSRLLDPLLGSPAYAGIFLTGMKIVWWGYKTVVHAACDLVDC